MVIKIRFVDSYLENSWKHVMSSITDSHDNEEELKQLRETISALEATEDSVEEKMVKYF